MKEKLALGTRGSDVILALESESVTGAEGNDFIVSYGAQAVSGGEGDDVIVSINNVLDPNAKPSTVSGGLGSDWIFSASIGGEIWGDVANSLLDPSGKFRYYEETTTDANGAVKVEKKIIKDEAENADRFFWFPNTTIMDAQKVDRLSFFGIPLVGASDDGGMMLSVSGLFAGIGQTIGLAQIYKPAIDTIYVDTMLPFLTYKFDKQRDGSYDLLIGNVAQAFLDATEALIGSTQLGSALKRYVGYQRIKGFVPAQDHGVFAYTYRGTDDKKLEEAGKHGKLDMVFNKTNPITAILSRLPETAINFALSGGGPLVDKALRLPLSRTDTPRR